MKQSRLMSWVETCISTATGFGLSLLIQWLVLPILLGVEIPLHTNIAFAAIMTVVSLARGFILRRVFEALHIRVPMSPAILAIAAERRRQIDAEGWTPEHDDEHATGELAHAAACYAMMPLRREVMGLESPRTHWRWSYQWWKPQDNRRDLIRSGAMIVAELDKMDRARKQKKPAPQDIPPFLPTKGRPPQAIALENQQEACRLSDASAALAKEPINYGWMP